MRRKGSEDLFPEVLFCNPFFGPAARLHAIDRELFKAIRQK